MFDRWPVVEQEGSVPINDIHYESASQCFLRMCAFKFDTWVNFLPHTWHGCLGSAPQRYLTCWLRVRWFAYSLLHLGQMNFVLPRLLCDFLTCWRKSARRGNVSEHLVQVQLRYNNRALLRRIRPSLVKWRLPANCTSLASAPPLEFVLMLFCEFWSAAVELAEAEYDSNL